MQDVSYPPQRQTFPLSVLILHLYGCTLPEPGEGSALWQVILLLLLAEAVLCPCGLLNTSID
jgi:hypothetical protein